MLISSSLFGLPGHGVAETLLCSAQLNSLLQPQLLSVYENLRLGQVKFPAWGW
jgi:hypothetical protein